MKKLTTIFVFISAITCFAQLPTDCIDSVIVCGNSNVNLDVNGIGTQELNNSNTCSSQENNSIWLKVSLVSSGTLGFTLTPNSTSIVEDYDFFIFGPNASCGNLGQAIRCSTTNPQAAGQGNNLTGMNSTSTDVSEGPGFNGDSFVKWLDVLAGETYYIVIDRPIGNSPFSLEWTGTAKFHEPPSNESNTTGTSLNLENCDVSAPFDDGFTVFNLEANTNLIKGTQKNTEITYHNTISDANIGINELSSPYTNIKNPQTIYARITNTTTGCFELTEFDLKVNLGPSYTKPENYELCDNLDDGDATNGRIIFDLPSRNNELLNGKNPSDFNITYYKSRNDAETKTKPLSNLYYNNIAFNEEIFIRIEDKLNPICRSITSVNLTVNLPPIAYNHTLIQCDEDGIIDGLTQFNLNEANTVLTGNIAGISTKFYTDSARTIEINGDAFNNTSNPQIIFVEVINNTTKCTSTSELTLTTSSTDSNDIILPICDDDGIEDGFQTFNLLDANSDIINGLPNNLTISYYETYEDALLEQNNLTNTYTNTTAYLQTIYARVENTNNCYGISEINLTVNKLPEIEIEDSTYYCLNDSPKTITLNAGLKDNSPSNYTYNWSTGETNPEIEINKPGTYTVTVYNANNCSKERTINVEASNTATFEPIGTQNNKVTIMVSGEGTYEYQLLDEDNTIAYTSYQKSNIFENVAPGIYTAAVRDIKNDCGIVNEKVSVIGFPKSFTPNGDGINDTWQIKGASNLHLNNITIYIYDRYGKLVKGLSPLGNGWNGTFNGKTLPADDYWFSITLEDGSIFKNHFALKL